MCRNGYDDMIKQKIGILGGTFDPPHIAHLIIANDVKHKLGLDEIWFIPTNQPPHKQKTTTSNEHRYHMLKRAINDVEYFKVNPIEFERSGRSYTIDTISALQSSYPTADFFFLIGADMVEYLPNWHQINELIEKVQFVGLNRPGFDLETTYPILKVDVPYMEISSTDVRQRLKKGQPVTFLLPHHVLAYIREYELYE